MSSITGAGGSHTALSLSSGHSPVAAGKQEGAGKLGLASVTSFAGGHSHEQVAAAQSHAGGNLTLHFHDGSSITVVGVTHIDTSFIH